MRLYHGTSSANLDRIKREGLHANMRPGGDACWSRVLGVPIIRLGSPVPSVFAAGDIEDASEFAAISALLNGGTPVVVEIEYPEGEPLTDDLNHKLSKGGSYRLPKVEPQWIVGVLPALHGLQGIPVQDITPANPEHRSTRLEFLADADHYGA